MKIFNVLLWIVAAVVIVAQVYLIVDQAIIVDDLRERQKDTRETLQSLLDYVSVNSRCDRSAEELYKKMEAEKYDFVLSAEGDSKITGFGTNITIEFRDNKVSSILVPGEFKIDVKCG